MSTKEPDTNCSIVENNCFQSSADGWATSNSLLEQGVVLWGAQWEPVSAALPSMFVNQLSQNELCKAVYGGKLGAAGNFDAKRIRIKNNLDK